MVSNLYNNTNSHFHLHPDGYHNIQMVYYLAGVGGVGCTPTDRVLGW